MFEESYNLFGEELFCHVIKSNSPFNYEADSYTYIKKMSSKGGYKYLRIDTVDQIGFPDILLMKRSEYCMIEAKRLNKIHLVNLEKDLSWQFGQVAFAVRAIKLGLDYAIAVCKDYNLAIIAKERTLCNLRNNLTF